MTWDEAVRLHDSLGHRLFVQEALARGKSEMFIRNVCNARDCKE